MPRVEHEDSLRVRIPSVAALCSQTGPVLQHCPCEECERAGGKLQTETMVLRHLKYHEIRSWQQSVFINQAAADEVVQRDQATPADPRPLEVSVVDGGLVNKVRPHHG